MLKLDKPLAFIDLETTGINLSSDRIVEISILKILPDGSQQSKTMRINPEMQMLKIPQNLRMWQLNCATF